MEALEGPSFVLEAVFSLSASLSSHSSMLRLALFHFYWLPLTIRLVPCRVNRALTRLNWLFTVSIDPLIPQ